MPVVDAEARTWPDVLVRTSTVVDRMPPPFANSDWLPVGVLARSVVSGESISREPPAEPDDKEMRRERSSKTERHRQRRVLGVDVTVAFETSRTGATHRKPSPSCEKVKMCAEASVLIDPMRRLSV